MNWKPAGPWVRGVALELLFQTHNVRPGDLLLVGDEEAIRFVLEDRRNTYHVCTIDPYCDERMLLTPKRAVKAWCRPPLDLEL